MLYKSSNLHFSPFLWLNVTIQPIVLKNCFDYYFIAYWKYMHQDDIVYSLSILLAYPSHAFGIKS